MVKLIDLQEFGRLNDESYKLAGDYIYMHMQLFCDLNSLNKIELEFNLTHGFVFSPRRKCQLRPFKKSWK